MSWLESREGVEENKTGRVYEFTKCGNIIEITFFEDSIRVCFDEGSYDLTMNFKAENIAACNSLESATIIADYIYRIVEIYGSKRWKEYVTLHYVRALEKAGVKNIFVVLR